MNKRQEVIKRLLEIEEAMATIAVNTEQLLELIGEKPQQKSGEIILQIMKEHGGLWSPYSLSEVLAGKGIVKRENVISVALCRLRDRGLVERVRTNVYRVAGAKP